MQSVALRRVLEAPVPSAVVVSVLMFEVRIVSAALAMVMESCQAIADAAVVGALLLLASWSGR